MGKSETNHWVCNISKMWVEKPPWSWLLQKSQPCIFGNPNKMFTMKTLNQICNLAALHFSCLICRISSDGGGFRGRWWHDSRNEQDASRPYKVLSIVLARAASSWEVRDADARDAWQGWMRIHRVGVTRDKPNCGRSRCKSVNELQVWPFSRYLLGTVLQPQSKSK